MESDTCFPPGGPRRGECSRAGYRRHSPRAIRRARLLAAVLLLAVAAPASGSDDGVRGESPAPPDSGGAPDGAPDLTPPRWIFAVEDTSDLPAFFRMSTVKTNANRLGIGEIVDRCIAREEELRSRIESHEFTALVNSVMYVGGRDANAKRRLVTEQVDRTFFRKGAEEKTIPLRFEQYELSGGERKEWNPGEDDGAVKITYGDFQQLPFYLEDRGDYDFEILSREIVGDRVIYEVRLTPKSDFEIAPTGRIWIDTTDFQILREEFDFEDRVPMPVFIRRVGPFVRERERIGDVWVWKRFLIRVDLRMGYLRFLDGDLPDRVEFAVNFRDHRVNEGWSIDPDAVAADGRGKE